MIDIRGKKEAITPPEIVSRLIAAAGEDMVLVGGQALAFWVVRYELVVPSGHVAISSDTDFLAGAADGRALVERMAEVIHGQALFPSRRALTALVGQAIRPINDDEFVNVDVIDSVIGIAHEEVRSRAVHAMADGHAFLVMHPLHVLRSRLANIYTLAEKQSVKGEMQLALAIDVAREFVRAEARDKQVHSEATRSPIQPYISEIERMALDDAGRKVAQRFGIRVADAIDPSSIPAGPFWDRKWPTLATLMSADYASRYRPPGP